MLNTYQLNGARDKVAVGILNNPYIPNLSSETNNDIVFNGYGLQNTAIITSNISMSAPSRELNLSESPSNDGEIYNSSFVRSKLITLTGRIFESSPQSLENQIDAFKKSVMAPNRNLDITPVVGGVKRRYKATLQNPNSIFAGRQGSDISTVPFNLQFLAHEGVGKDIDYKNDTFLITSLAHTTSIWSSGTWNSPLWLILNFTTVLGVTSVKIENLSTKEAIEITVDLSDGDILQIDGIEKNVEKNGETQDYDGYFPGLAPGENIFEITTTGTLVSSISATAKHKDYYL